jgi:hypothetical protein
MAATENSERFLTGVQDGWHAIEAVNLRPADWPGCHSHAWSACDTIVRLAKDEIQPYRPDDIPVSHDPCPACRWIVAARTGTLDAALAALPPLAHDIAAAILNEAARDEGREPDDPRAMQLLAFASRHAPAALVAEECSEGGCDHGGGCPGTSACRACSLQAGSWAGEWEGQYLDECTIPAPCAPLLALAAHYGVTPATGEAPPVIIACKNCPGPIERCAARPSHAGCSSAYGWIHADGGAHACEPGSDGPYAQPSDAFVRAALERVTIDPASPASQAAIDRLMVARRKAGRR